MLLQRANVQEASYRIRLVEDAEPARSGSGSGSGFTPIEMEQIGSGWGAPASKSGSGQGSGVGTGFDTPVSMQALEQVRSPLGGTVYQAFLHSRSAAFEVPLDPSFYEQVDQALARVATSAEQEAPDD